MQMIPVSWGSKPEPHTYTASALPDELYHQPQSLRGSLHVGNKALEPPFCGQLIVSLFHSSSQKIFQPLLAG